MFQTGQEILKDYKSVDKVKVEEGVKLEFVEVKEEEGVRNAYIDVKQIDKVKIEHEGVKQEELIIEDKYDETYDDSLHESYEEDIEEDQNETCSDNSGAKSKVEEENGKNADDSPSAKKFDQRMKYKGNI